MKILVHDLVCSVLISALASLVLRALPVHATSVEVEISQIGQATHFEFSGVTDWNYETSKLDQNKHQFLVPKLSATAVAKITQWSDQFIKKVEVVAAPAADQNFLVLHWQDPNVEFFDYFTDQPPHLIIDVFREVKIAEVSPGAAQAPKQVVKTAPQIKKQKLAGKANPSQYNKYDRAPAGSELIIVEEEYKPPKTPREGVFDGGDPDYERFRMKPYQVSEEAIIASRQNIYLRFPMLKMPTSQLKDILKVPRTFRISEQDTTQSKEAQLLHVLYEKNRPGAFFKVYRRFLDKYPQSQYLEVARSLAAEMHYRLWERDGDAKEYQLAESEFKYLIKNFPKSNWNEWRSLVLYYSELERGAGLKTIQNFLSFQKDFPSSNSIDQSYKALADGYLIMNRFDESLATLKKLEKNAMHPESAAEARYRRGDVLFSKKEFEAAVGEYKAALVAYPNYEDRIPNAHFNLAESYFWLGQYFESLEHYVRFIELFPAHDHGGYALTRIGEVLDILGADRQRVMGAFLESYFRYRSSPGADVARLRLISQQMPKMRDKEIKKAHEEMQIIAQNNPLPRIQEFIVILESKGLQQRGEFETAMQMLISYYQKNPTTASVEFFKARILSNLADILKRSVTGNDFMAALNTNSKYANTWLRNQPRLDIPYFVGRAYEQAGVVREAESHYQKLANYMEKIKGTVEEKERRVNEHLPSEAELNLRLAAVEFSRREYSESFNLLRKISNNDLPAALRVERVHLLAQLFEIRGQRKQAIEQYENLIKIWDAPAVLLAEIHYELGRLYVGEKKWTEALRQIENNVSLKLAKNEIPRALWQSTLKLKGEVLEKTDQKLAAVEVYLEILSDPESQAELFQLRYHTGEILFDAGDIRGAEQVWQQLAAQPKAQFYAELAKDRLADKAWRDNYDRYVDRKPAARSTTKEGS